MSPLICHYFIDSNLDRPKLINPGWIDSDAEINSQRHTITEENCKVVIISAFDSAHVKNGVWIKAAPKP